MLEGNSFVCVKDFLLMEGELVVGYIYGSEHFAAMIARTTVDIGKFLCPKLFGLYVSTLNLKESFKPAKVMSLVM